MATPPDFTAGQVLTAAQMNAVGLWRITGCTVSSVGGTAATANNGVITVGSGNTSVTVSNAFSADYDNYLIQYNAIDASTPTNIKLTLGSSITSYYWGLIYTILGGASTNGLQGAAAASWEYAGVLATDKSGGSIELFNPFLSERTGIRSTYLEFATTGAIGQMTGFHNSATSYSAFTITPGAGNMTGGTIRVYGYRN